MAFGRRWGELNESQALSNRRTDGTLRDADDPLMRLFRGNEGWHTDSSFEAVSAKASILSARQVPDRGGQTEWADMRARLRGAGPDDPRVHCGPRGLPLAVPLPGEHRRIGESTARALAELHAMAGSGTNSSPGQSGYRQETKVPLRPLVKLHPQTGRPALCIGRHAHGIPGLDEDESRSLLDRLLAGACRAPRVYGHRWQVGDVVIWDNRRVLHRVRPWPAGEARVMHHTSVAGDPVTEAASNQSPALRRAARSCGPRRQALVQPFRRGEASRYSA